MTDDNNIILFDGICNLCNGLVSFIIKRDAKEKFKFAALQSLNGKTLLNKFNLSDDKIDTIVYVKGEKYFTNSTAVIYILKDLGRGWKLFSIFIFIPGFIRNFIYDLVSKYRYKIFGRLKSCKIPDSGLEHRFLT